MTNDQHNILSIVAIYRPLTILNLIFFSYGVRQRVVKRIEEKEEERKKSKETTNTQRNTPTAIDISVP